MSANQTQTLVSDVPVITAGDIPSILDAFDGIAPVWLWGSPGVGKSESVRQYAESRGAILCDIRLSQYESVDLRGLPDIESGQTVWRVPSTIPFVNTQFPTDTPIVLFLDEILQAPPSVQAVAFQLVLDRRIGEHKLLPNVQIVAASNRTTDMAGTSAPLTPLLNRFAHFEIEVSIDAWKAWAYQNGVDTRVIGFLSLRPALLDQFQTALKTRARAFATPRAWRMASEIIKRGVVSFSPLAACVGAGVATELITFLESSQDVPSFESIVEAPAKVALPERTDGLYATVSMCVARVTRDTAKPVAAFVRRLPPEYQVVFVNDLSRSRAAVATHPDMVKLQLEVAKFIK